LKTVAAGSAGSAVFGRALLALAEGKEAITLDMIRQAEWISGLSYTNEERDLMLEGLNRLEENLETIRAISVDNSVPPALHFATIGALDEADARRDSVVELSQSWTPPPRPTSDEDLAFAPLTVLAKLIRSRRMSSVDLTKLYLERLRRFDPLLECVVSYTEKTAFEQAQHADREIAAGHYRGPLHGIPWGAKDLLAVPGYRTTWGAKPYEDQVREEKATVVSHLENAGAVLVAKLTLGALAMGDVWFGGKTKNPWKPSQGSSGSSAGPASATAAGAVGFAIGTETRGSIVSPCNRCGTTGLRPTFGRVSRFGAMALSWSMDKIGPIARSVEDCALVFGAIHGADGLDPTAVDRAFHWPMRRDLRSLKVGFVQEAFESDRTEGAEEEDQKAALREWQDYDRATLRVLNDLGFELIPIELPKKYPADAIGFILTTESAAAFDELTRSGRDDLLVRQDKGAWPNTFRRAQLTPAVEYIRANRIRTLLMQEMEEKIAGIDVYVSPSYEGGNVGLTNLTGHPSVVLPNGFRTSDGTPTSITFTGRLFGETELLAVAHAYQQATDFHLERPPIERFATENQKAD
jgi:Asp-tRNA(Asn)/Glu-tRNA(Gln) amidotransferase A subunit family amidase